MDTRLKKEINKRLIMASACVFIGVFIISAQTGPGVAFIVAASFAGVAYLALNEYLGIKANEYEMILQAIRTLAEDNFEEQIKENAGVFEPMKEELLVLREQVKKAVEVKVKSERMKAELVTNVSHDLKTPLTAITTYVELLKKEDITEEERKSYIETLEKKSARMKVLIEDLFDLSKVNSNDVTLDISQVDVVNLMKQVVVEHNESYESMGLQLIWNTPEDKVEVSLDNQKTYRIFENLFLNIEKYAMKNSRVYIDVSAGKNVEIVLRNMSEEPLHISGEQLTERFVRGDQSRNTEGSGLGLAIAKSFTEVQGGQFEVIVDGDLFKTKMVFQ